MYDHLMRFETENDAKADPVMAAYWHAGQDEEPGSWDTSRCIPGVSVYAVTGTETVDDGQGGEYEREVRESYSGWFINVALPVMSAELRDVDGNACRLIASREAADLGQPFLVYVAPDMVPEILGEARVEPTFAGSNYPFGQIPS